MHVLVVEDDVFVAADLAADLSCSMGLRVEISLCCRDALKSIGTETAFAILDINLGAETSFPVAEKLESLGIPFIFVSGDRQSSLPLEWTYVPFVSKPPHLAHLMERVKEALPQLH